MGNALLRTPSTTVLHVDPFKGQVVNTLPESLTEEQVKGEIVSCRVDKKDSLWNLQQTNICQLPNSPIAPCAITSRRHPFIYEDNHIY